MSHESYIPVPLADGRYIIQGPGLPDIENAELLYPGRVYPSREMACEVAKLCNNAFFVAFLEGYKECNINMKLNNA